MSPVPPPPLPGVPSGPRGPAAFLSLFGLLGVLLFVVSLGVLILRFAEAQIQREVIPSLTDRAFPDADSGQALDDDVDEAQILPITGRRNVLVVGRDTREGLDPQTLQALGTEDDGSDLTDTILLIQYSASDDRARILSFPRDLRIDLDGRFVKINALSANGGPSLLVDTIEQMVGVDLDHYVEVDIAGFLQLTDAIGGVEVCLPQPLVDVYAGADLPAGCQLLDGIDAAGFVRARRVADSFGANDYGRAARQQYFIRQAVSEILSAGTLTSPSRVRALLDVARESVVTDSRLSTSEALRLATTARAFDPSTLQTATVPGVTQLINGASFEVMQPEAEDLFASLRAGAPFPADLVQPDATEPAAAAPAVDDPGVRVARRVEPSIRRG